MPVVRDYIAAHAAMYDAIKANDTIDADGDGVAAAVGLSMSVADWEPRAATCPRAIPTTSPRAIASSTCFTTCSSTRSCNGTFDADLDGALDEPHPEWAGTLDWLGVQYYFRAGVTGAPALLPAPSALTPCFQGFDFGSCLPTHEPTLLRAADGLRVLGRRHPQRARRLRQALSDAAARRHRVRHRDRRRRAPRRERSCACSRRSRSARDEDGVDVRGYYHWSADRQLRVGARASRRTSGSTASTSRRTRARRPRAPTCSARSRRARTLTTEQRKQYGGTGPMTPDTGDGRRVLRTKLTDPVTIAASRRAAR